jgi:hypothetical protein
VPPADALSLDEGNPKALYRRALAYEQQSEFDSAIVDCEYALSLMTRKAALLAAETVEEPGEERQAADAPTPPPKLTGQAAAVAKLLAQLRQRKKKHAAKERKIWTKAFGS